MYILLHNTPIWYRNVNEMKEKYLKNTLPMKKLSLYKVKNK